MTKLLLTTLITLSLTTCSHASELSSQSQPTKTTCHQGKCLVQHQPVNRSSLKERQRKILERDKQLKSTSSPKLDKPLYREPPQRQESHPLSLRELGVSYKACKDFSQSCRSRVDSLEQYKKKADETIVAQEKKIVAVKEEKKSFPVVHVIISVLVGALTGVVLF